MCQCQCQEMEPPPWKSMMRFSPVILFALAARRRPGCFAFEPPVAANSRRRPLQRLVSPQTGSARTTTPLPASRSSPLFPSDDSEYEQSGRSPGSSDASREAAEDPFDEAVDRLASALVGQWTPAEGDDGAASPPVEYQLRTVIRVVLPSLLAAAVSTAAYAPMVTALLGMHESLSQSSPDLYNDQVLMVLSNDLSQYVQNILTTCALLFGMLVGQVSSSQHV